MSYAHFLLVGSIVIVPLMMLLRTSQKLRVDSNSFEIAMLALPSVLVRLIVELLRFFLDAITSDAYRIIYMSSLF